MSGNTITFLYKRLFLSGKMDYYHILLLRHAKSAGNHTGTITGQIDSPPLIETVPDALVQAILDLQLPITDIHSTDVKRGALPARDLYGRLCAHFTGILYTETPVLRERHVGDYQGKRYDQIGKPPEMFAGEYFYRMGDIEGGEDLKTVQERARSAANILCQYRDDLTIGMLHCCFMGFLADELRGAAHQEEFVQIGNLQGMLFEMRDDCATNYSLFRGGQE